MIRLSFIVLCLLICGNLLANDKDRLVVAEVNGHQILLKDFETTYQQNLLFIGDKIVTKEKVINDLINRELGIDRAKKSRLQEDGVVKQKMEDVLYHAQVSKDLEPLLKKIVVTDDDVKTYYAKHPEYRTAHILFRMTANPSDNEIKGALEVAMKVYEQLKTDPQKFSELANKFSQTSAAPN
ncbi:MAG: peptidylprolyl isomerase, partial [Bdellovibrionota bacterium]